MAEPQNPLRATDFLPTRFQGDVIDADLARAHFLAFRDYLEAHDLHQPDDQEQVQNLVRIFTRTLKGQARLWIEGKQFEDLDTLRDQFLARFSPSTSYIARTQAFRDLVYVPGETAEVFLAKISKAALPLGYGDPQIRDKFLSSLPAPCKSAVLMSSPTDAPLQDLVAKVQCYLDLNPAESHTSPEDLAMANDLPDAPTLPSEDNNLKDLCNRIESLETRFRENERPSRQENRQEDTQDLRHRYHSADSRAFQAPGNFQRSRKPLVCYRCRSTGHIARFCRLNMPHFAQQGAHFHPPPRFQNARFPPAPNWPQPNFPNVNFQGQNHNIRHPGTSEMPNQHFQ